MTMGHGTCYHFSRTPCVIHVQFHLLLQWIVSAHHYLFVLDSLFLLISKTAKTTVSSGILTFCKQLPLLN